MLFITNRFPKGSIQTRVGRKFEFDLKVMLQATLCFSAIEMMMGASLRLVE